MLDKGLVKMNYGFSELRRIPREMWPWRLRLKSAPASEFGKYVLIEVDQADIEQHHQVEVIDESGDPLRGVWVVFGTPGGGTPIGLGAEENYWENAPAELLGNAQRTNVMGCAQHTFGSGGEDIFLFDVDQAGVLRLPSPIIYNCGAVGRPVGCFDHTGVKLRFQRRQEGIVPRGQRLDEIEARLSAIEAILRDLT